MFWSAEKIVEATGGKLQGEAFAFSTLSTDTRTIQKGEFFVALKGDNFDGHHYLEKAAERGAIGALVEQPCEGMPCIIVEDSLAALQAMARYRREKSDANIIGITGSVGKTSAKEMLKLCLAAYGETYATAGNYNNHIGLPITLCNMPQSTEYAIIEMGMNHAGEISFLSKIARPHIAMITTVAAVHLEFFESVAGIAHAKAEIFDGMQGGTSILPIDNEYYAILLQAAQAQHCDILTFGEMEQSNLRLVSPAVDYIVNGESRSVTLATRGAHWPLASLGVLACVSALNLPLDKAEAALTTYREQQGRGAVESVPWQGGKMTLMDDAYNASPVSMQAALQTLSQLGQGRKLAILGEMLELGEQSPQLHAALAEPIAQHKIDAVVTVGNGMQTLAERLPADVHVAHFGNAQEAMLAIKTLVKPDDIVLCKGSHGSGVYRLVAELKNDNNKPQETRDVV